MTSMMAWSEVFVVVPYSNSDAFHVILTNCLVKHLFVSQTEVRLPTQCFTNMISQTTKPLILGRNETCPSQNLYMLLNHVLTNVSQY